MRWFESHPHRHFAELGMIDALVLSEAFPPISRAAPTVSDRDDLHAGGHLPKDDYEREPSQDDAARSIGGGNCSG